MKYENKTYDELSVGDTAELRRVCLEDDFWVYANSSGNYNPMHLSKYDGDGDGSTEAIAPALWLGSLLSAVLGNILPGAGTLYRTQSFEFLERAHAGDEVMAQVTVLEKCADREVRFRTDVSRVSDGELLVTGEATVIAPRVKQSFEDLDVPGLIVQSHKHFRELLEKAKELAPLRTVVVAPEESKSLEGALLAAEHEIIVPILIGSRDLILATAREIGHDVSGFEIIDEPNHGEAARRAVDLITDDTADAMMKGHLHTNALLKAALRKVKGLRTGRWLSHVFVMDVPGLQHPLLVTDAAINIYPDLKAKVDIVQNAIDLALSIGIVEPKVGVLSAVETVNPDISSSIDAALLSKMAERGQITGGLVEGPLAMDNAVDLAAARTKGLTSPVAGHADILVVPNIDSGNMLAKQLAYIGKAEAAGVVMGAKVPIVLNSRSDDAMSRLASCAIAAMHHHRISAPPKR